VLECFRGTDGRLNNWVYWQRLQVSSKYSDSAFLPELATPRGWTLPPNSGGVLQCFSAINCSTASVPHVWWDWPYSSNHAWFTFSHGNIPVNLPRHRILFSEITARSGSNQNTLTRREALQTDAWSNLTPSKTMEQSVAKRTLPWTSDEVNAVLRPTWRNIWTITLTWRYRFCKIKKWFWTPGKYVKLHYYRIYLKH
jgi:hypothetical protein